MIAWFNGELLPLDGVSISATDRGFLLGDGFFETIAANKGKVARFSAHMDRLEQTAQKLAINLPFVPDEIADAIQEVLLGCQLREERAALRLTISRGSGPRGLLPPADAQTQFLISAAPAPETFEPAKVAFVSVRRNEFSPSATIKSLCYLDNILAFEEAKKNGADEALLLNTQGYVCEGTISNIFFIKGDCLYTPKISDGCLPGVMRACVIKTAKEIGLDVKEQTLRADFINTVDAAFLTNSLMRVRTISQIYERTLPLNTWTEKLLDAIIQSEQN